MTKSFTPGPIVLFGSGETSPSGGKIFDHVFRRLPPSPKVALLETPAGFELNSPQVVGKVADFIHHHLQNYNPNTIVIPARKRGTAYSPDDPDVVAPILSVDLIFMGPGSPTYAVRQLSDSLAWHYLIARHRMGAALAIASAAAIAFSAHALPIYEIFKVGEDPHWKAGLDFFSHYGLSLIFVPHWNNREGGKGLDTSRCFIGQKRFNFLLEKLPPESTVIGIDEHTGLLMDLAEGICEVLGRGNVSVLCEGEINIFRAGHSLPISLFGPYRTPEPQEGLPAKVWERANEVQRTSEVRRTLNEQPPSNVMALVEKRNIARAQEDWPIADRLREEIAEMGWQVLDTPGGPVVRHQ